MASTFVLPPPPTDILQGASLFLDFDGTLVEIASRHDDVTVEHRLHALMHSLTERLSGRVAIVSGRSAEMVRTLFAAPTFAFGGSHGLELHWADGRSWTPPHTDLSRVVSELRAFEQTQPGVLVEVKPFGVAVHFRLAPEARERCQELVAQLAHDHGLTIQTGKMVVELKATDADKGSAIKAFMREAPMRGGRPVFLGDDDTDEAGFAMAQRLGGVGVLVGSMRPTAASYRLAGVEDTLQWLESASRERGG